MPRTKPTTKLGVYGQYDINPEHAVELYNESKAQEKYYIKEPCWDVARAGIEANAIQNELEHVQILELQTALRNKVKIDGKINGRRIQQMYTIDEQLREEFISVNDFIRDCEEKKRSADEKAMIETEVQTQLIQKIDQISGDLKTLTDFHDHLEATVAEFQPYEQVVEQVMAESELYKNVKDLMDRCDALMIAQVEIGEMEEGTIKKIEEMRENMVQATNEAALTVMGLDNELADLERCYNASKEESIKWGRVLAATKDSIAEKETVTFRLLDQIQQLYGLFCRRSGVPVKFGRDQVEEQLDVIKGEIQFFLDVIEHANKLMTDEKKSRIGTHGSEN